MSEAKREQVFISYAHENLETVKTIVYGLRERKLNVWFDKEHLSPGRWKRQIIKAINRSRFFVICISEAALRKTGDEKPGFQDDELQTAYEIAQNQPEQEFTIVPVRLEDCKRGDFRTSSFQQYDLFPDSEKGLDNLAVHLGGISLSEAKVKDERTENEKFIDSLFGNIASNIYAKDFEKALIISDAILAMDLNDYDYHAWFSKGFALVQLGRYEEALQPLDKFLELNPDEAAIGWFYKGIALGGLGRYEEALQALDKALELNPDDARPWSNKGFALVELGRYEEALQALDKFLELNPDDARPWSNKGFALVQLGRYEEALQALDKALELNPDDARFWSNKGFALVELGRYEEALQALDKALELNPDDARPWSNKGFALVELGRYEEALQALDKFLKLNPDEADSWFTKGIALGGLGRYEEGQIALKRASELDRKHK